MANMTLHIAGELMGNTTPEELQAQLIGSADYLTPGVSWDEIVVTRNPKEGADAVTIVAKVTTDEVVQDNYRGYQGQAVTGGFVTSYVMGAEAYWASACGNMFFPHGAMADVTLASATA